MSSLPDPTYYSLPATFPVPIPAPKTQDIVALGSTCPNYAVGRLGDMGLPKVTWGQTALVTSYLGVCIRPQLESRVSGRSVVSESVEPETARAISLRLLRRQP